MTNNKFTQDTKIKKNVNAQTEDRENKKNKYNIENYWIELFSDLINNTSENFYGLKLINPHLLILEITDEIELNKLRNKDNKNMFIKFIQLYLNVDTIIETNFKTEFLLLMKALEMKESNNIYILKLCKKILAIFKTEKYFQLVLDRLKNILTNFSYKDCEHDQLKTITEHIIVEFVIKGYSKDTIRRNLNGIFEKYHLIDGILSTSFPHKIDRNLFKNEKEFNRDSYNKAVIDFIDNLTLEDRIDGLLKYYTQEPKEVYYIFHIEGLKGDIDLKIGDVHFYSPDKIKYVNINKQDLRFINYEEKKYLGNDKSNMPYLNCAVKMKYIDQLKSKFTAIHKIKKVSSILYLHLPLNFPITEYKNEYCIVDSNKNIISREIITKENTRKNYIYNWFDLNNITDTEKLKQLIGEDRNFLFSMDSSNKFNEKIIKSLYWFREGMEGKRPEEQLVNFWISIESLMNLKSTQKKSTIQNILNYLPRLLVMDYLKRIKWVLFIDLYKSKDTERFIPDLEKKCGISIMECKVFDYNKLIDNLDLLINSIQSKYLKNKIKKWEQIFTDPEYFKKFIQSEIDIYKNSIISIYRYRNQIVHDANINLNVLEYYADIVKNYSQSLLHTILEQLEINNYLKEEEYFVDHEIAFNLLQSKLEVKSIGAKSLKDYLLEI